MSDAAILKKGAERRREERIPQTGEIRFQTGRKFNGGPTQRAQLVNCSVHGIGFQSDQALLLGTEIAIASKLAAAPIYKVRCCFENDSGFFIGAETDQVVAEDATAVAGQLVGSS